MPRDPATGRAHAGNRRAARPSSAGSLALRKQRHHVLVKVIGRLVVALNGRLHRRIEGLYHVCSVGSGAHEDGHVVLLREREALRRDRHVHVHLVGHADDRDALAVLAELLVPGHQVLVGHLAGHVEAQDARVRTVVVARVQRLEALLARGVPEVHVVAAAVHDDVLAEERERVRGELVLRVVVHQVALHELALAGRRVAQQDDLDGLHVI
mmetsp:Transcript_14523/g.49157  ORF Transcript_14523/g.49157 Transcript_14523/m.49157 type:complete len:211 (-) Transcript_14523:102-734(-)